LNSRSDVLGLDVLGKHVATNEVTLDVPVLVLLLLVVALDGDVVVAGLDRDLFRLELVDVNVDLGRK
jgi:hypothetical protein